VAIANYSMASAAYYLGSQADEVVASPSAQVGWIGTVSVHQEFAKADEMAGVTTTIFRDPPGKFGGNEYEPLSDQARAEKQQAVEDYSGQFYAAVSKGRGVPVSTVKRDFGAGGGLTAARAKAAGLVDRVETIDQTIARMATGKVKPRSSAQATAISTSVLAAVTDPAELLDVAAGGRRTDEDLDELALERAIAARSSRSRRSA
jgi:ClpP class serine protease